MSDIAPGLVVGRSNIGGIELFSAIDDGASLSRRGSVAANESLEGSGTGTKGSEVSAGPEGLEAVGTDDARGDALPRRRRDDLMGVSSRVADSVFVMTSTLGTDDLGRF